MAKGNTVVVRGELNWAKVIGEPRLNEYKKRELGVEEREWTVDVSPDAAGLEKFKEMKITEKLREPKGEKDTRTGKFVTFRHAEYRKDKDGDKVKNDPIKIVDATGQAWPEGKLIGNGSIADVKFRIPERRPGRPYGLYIQAIRVLEHVPFEVEEFEPLSEDDRFFAGDKKKDTPQKAETPAEETDEDFDDEIPF